MTPFRDFTRYDAVGLAELIRAKQVTPEEALAAVIERTEKINPQLGCVVLRMDEYARKQIASGLPYGPFRGVPLMLKDLYLLVKDTPLVNGSKLFRDYVCPIDMTLAERFRAAGFVFCGRTSSPEFGLNMASDPVVFGPTRNPWKLDRSAGGSSGGSAAAVAARLVPVAHATDGGGSIRIPASNCGLVGLKPTRARNPAGPLVGEGWSGLSAAHVVARSVRDVAAILDVTSGPAEGDPYLAPVPARSFATEVGRHPGKLRIALQTKARNGAAVDKECAAAAESVAKLCAELGHHVENAAPEYDFDAMFEALWVLAGAAVTNAVEIRLAQLGRSLRDDDLEPMTLACYRRGKSDPIYLYVKALTAAHAIGRQMAAFFNKYDVTLSPITANPALPLGARPNMGEGDLSKFLADLYLQIPFTPLYNVSGCPALSVPLFWSEAGIPIGVQLGAAFGREDVLFRLAGQLEAARPWADKLPLVAM